MQRLVLDCRAVNRLFRQAEAMSLGSSTCWTDMLLDFDVDLQIAQCDIKDYFHACGIEEQLSEYFVMIEFSLEDF